MGQLFEGAGLYLLRRSVAAT